jgi:hypothetical protein
MGSQRKTPLWAQPLDRGPLIAVQGITTLSLIIALPFGSWLTHQHIDRVRQS